MEDKEGRLKVGFGIGDKQFATLRSVMKAAFVALFGREVVGVRSHGRGIKAKEKVVTLQRHQEVGRKAAKGRQVFGTHLSRPARCSLYLGQRPCLHLALLASWAASNNTGSGERVSSTAGEAHAKCSTKHGRPRV